MINENSEGKRETVIKQDEDEFAQNNESVVAMETTGTSVTNTVVNKKTKENKLKKKHEEKTLKKEQEAKAKAEKEKQMQQIKEEREKA